MTNDSKTADCTCATILSGQMVYKPGPHHDPGCSLRRSPETPVDDLAAHTTRDDALALIVGRLKHSAMSDGMWEDSREALLVLGYTHEQIQTAMERYRSL